jgi:hypothetical protein
MGDNSFQPLRSSQTYTVTRVSFFPSLQSRSEITLLHKASRRNISTLQALARHAQEHNLEPSREESVQSICGSYDPSSLRLAEKISSPPTQVSCIPIREHQHLDLVQYFLPLDPAEDEIDLTPSPCLSTTRRFISWFGLSHNATRSTLAFTSSFDLSGLSIIIAQSASATFFLVCITSMLCGRSMSS